MGSTPWINTIKYFVYILQSKRTGHFYVGHCDHLLRRFHQHRTGQNKSTRDRGPWWMPYYESYVTRPEAAQRERAIKAKKSAASIRAIIARHLPEVELL